MWGVSVLWVNSKLCNVRAYRQYALFPQYFHYFVNSTVHIVWNINRGQRGVNGSARRGGPFTPGWTTYFRTFVLRGVSNMVSTGKIFIHRLNRQCGGGGFLSCGLPASSAMSGLTVSMHLVYPSWIPQYILFETLTEARAGWTSQPAGLASSPPSELRTPAHLFWGGFPSW